MRILSGLRVCAYDIIAYDLKMCIFTTTNTVLIDTLIENPSESISKSVRLCQIGKFSLDISWFGIVNVIITNAVDIVEKKTFDVTCRLIPHE